MVGASSLAATVEPRDGPAGRRLTFSAGGSSEDASDGFGRSSAAAGPGREDKDAAGLASAGVSNPSGEDFGTDGGGDGGADAGHNEAA